MNIREKIVEAAEQAVHVVCGETSIEFYLRSNEGEYNYIRKTGTFVPGKRYAKIVIDLTNLTIEDMVWLSQHAPATIANRISDLRCGECSEYDDMMYPVTGHTTMVGLYKTTFLNGYVIKA